MLEPIFMDPPDAFAEVFSPRAKVFPRAMGDEENVPRDEKSSDFEILPDNELFDFDNAIWDTLFDDFDKEFESVGCTFEPIPLVTIAVSNEEKIPKQVDTENVTLVDTENLFVENLFVPIVEKPKLVEKPKKLVEKPKLKLAEKPKLRKRKLVVDANASGETKRLKPAAPTVSKTDTSVLNLFATPRQTWSVAKQNRFNAMQRLQSKRLKGRFGVKPKSKSTVRKDLANRRKRTKKGQFARTSKFKWVSVCDLQS